MTTNPLCADCGERPLHARGRCGRCYQRAAKAGLFTATHRLPLADRIASSIEETPDGCWLWTGTTLQKNGYARIKVEGKFQLAHRLAYEALTGPIPEGLQLDHLCRVRHCVNPSHLEPVTPRENVLRARRDHCKYGHEFTAENTQLADNGGRSVRICRACRRRRTAEKWRRDHPKGAAA